MVAFVKEEMPKGKRREFGVRRGKGKGEGEGEGGRRTGPLAFDGVEGDFGVRAGADEGSEGVGLAGEVAWWWECGYEGSLRWEGELADAPLPL